MANCLTQTKKINWGLEIIGYRISNEINDEINRTQPDNIYNWHSFSTEYDKVLLENYLSNASGGTVSLDNLYLLDNGRIMGLPPELDELINSMEPFYGRTREDATDDWFEKNKPVDIKSRLSNLLATGVNNVPDATANFDFVWGAEGEGEYKRWVLMFA